jgi:hypothetical protein
MIALCRKAGAQSLRLFMEVAIYASAEWVLLR